MVEVVGILPSRAEGVRVAAGLGSRLSLGPRVRASALPRVLVPWKARRLPGRSAAVFSEARVCVTAPPEPTFWNAGP